MAYVIPQHPVKSSHVKAVGYDAEREVLAVTFKDGHVWHYANITYPFAESFFNSESKGRFYAQQIRGKFPAEKMTGPCPKCGAIGIITNRCEDCGCADYEPDPRAFVEAKDGSRTPIGGRA